MKSLRNLLSRLFNKDLTNLTKAQSRNNVYFIKKIYNNILPSKMEGLDEFSVNFGYDGKIYINLGYKESDSIFKNEKIALAPMYYKMLKFYPERTILLECIAYEKSDIPSTNITKNIIESDVNNQIKECLLEQLRNKAEIKVVEILEDVDYLFIGYIVSIEGLELYIKKFKDFRKLRKFIDDIYYSLEMGIDQLIKNPEQQNKKY